MPPSMVRGPDEVEKYLNENNVEGLIEDAVNHLIQDAPSDPLAYLARFFHNKRKLAMKQGTTGLLDELQPDSYGNVQARVLLSKLKLSLLSEASKQTLTAS